NLSQSTMSLRQGMTTYIVSKALAASTWFVGRAADSTVKKLLNGSQGDSNMDSGCTAVDPAFGWCGSAVWQGSPNNQGLTLVQASSGMNNPYNMYQSFMETAAGFSDPLLEYFSKRLQIVDSDLG
ncbi:MAG: hypothetical protein Q9180_008887, partial [Flavoplaca navasiana]